MTRESRYVDDDDVIRSAKKLNPEEKREKKKNLYFFLFLSYGRCPSSSSKSREVVGIDQKRGIDTVNKKEM